MKISEIFQSKYLKADDLHGKRVIVRITSVTLEEISDTDSKPIMRFAGHEKGVVLNRTNSTACAQMFGDSTESWIGQQVELLAMPTHFQGKRVLGLVTLPIAPASAKPPFDDPAQFRHPGPHDAIIQPQQAGDLAQSESGSIPQDLDDIPF